MKGPRQVAAEAMKDTGLVTTGEAWGSVDAVLDALRDAGYLDDTGAEDFEGDTPTASAQNPERVPVILTVGSTSEEIGWVARDDLSDDPGEAMGIFLRKAADAFETPEETS